MSSHHPTSVLDHAGTLMELGRPAEALTILARATAAESVTPEYWLLRAHLHLAMRDGVAAAEAADRWIALDPHDEWAHIVRSRALNLTGRHAAAVTAAEEAVGLAPLSADAYLCLAEALHDLEPASRRAKPADPRELDAAMRCVELAPDQPPALVALAAAHARRKEWEPMRAAADRALALAPHDPWVHNELARIDVERRSYAVAASGFARSASLDPTDAAPRNFAVAVRALVLRRVWIAFLGIWASRIVATTIASESGVDLRRAWAGAAAAMVGLVMLLPIGRFVASLQPQMRPAALRAVRADRRASKLLGLSLAIFAAYSLAAVMPEPVSTGFFGIGSISYLVVVILSWKWRFSGEEA